jgi:hypothetical protein
VKVVEKEVVGEVVVEGEEEVEAEKVGIEMEGEEEVGAEKVGMEMDEMQVENRNDDDDEEEKEGESPDSEKRATSTDCEVHSKSVPKRTMKSKGECSNPCLITYYSHNTLL